MSDRGSQAVLVVEDEPTIADVIARYLDRGGYRTAIARDGPAAVQLAHELRPALVVLDLMLPGFDGFEVMKRIRNGERGDTAVILLTARGEQSDRIVGLRAG